jgi:methylated-DNA-protein-cysteine methyltransferase-like protein
MAEEAPLYQQIYDVVRSIPPGKVASYGQIAKIVGRCSARMVGYALAALKTSDALKDVPWHRVINARGRISVHGDGLGNAIQEQLLRQEGVEFDAQGCVDWEVVGWLRS